MGFFDDLFSSKTESKITDPAYGQKMYSYDYLQNLLRMDVPGYQVPQLTDIQLGGRDILNQYVSGGMPSGYNTIADYLTNLMNAPGDITQLPEYGAIVNTVNAETSDAVNQALRRTQLGGMPGSTPQGKAVGKEIAMGGEKMTAALAPYAEAERSRQLNAANYLANLMGQMDQATLSRIAASMSDPMALYKQMVAQAKYNQQMAPWTTQAPVASSIVGPGIDYTVTETPSILQQISPMIGAAIPGLVNAFGNNKNTTSSFNTYSSAQNPWIWSDERVKENIEELDRAIDKIKKLHSKTYNYTGSKKTDRRAGVIAQDVEKVLPEAIREIGGIKQVDYAAVTALAAQAVNELIDEVNKLKRKAA